MKKYMMSFFVVSILSLTSLVEAVRWEGVRNNTWFGVIINLTSSGYNDKIFTLPAGMLVWATSQAQLKVQTMRGWDDLNSNDYAYLDQEVEKGRQISENRFKRPVLYINTTGYSIGWEDGVQFEKNVFIVK